MATTTPNFGWPVPTSTDLVKDGATAIESLGDSIDASLLDLKGGTSGQVLSKNSNTDMDFTWVTSDDANAIQNAIVDAKGDLITATAADTPARLAVGTDGQVLTADSTAATGVKWATASSGTFPILTTTAASGDFATSSTSYVDVTNMTITRTPVSATNKIEVKASFSIYAAANVAIDFKLLAGATGSGLLYSGARGATGYTQFNVLFYFTNVAASSTVFKLQMKTDGGSVTLYGSGAGFNNNFSVLEVY